MTGQLMHDQTSSLVRERDRRRLRAMGAVLALGGLLVGGVLGYVWLQVQRVRVSYEMEDLRALRADVEEQNRKLRLELSSLRSYARGAFLAERRGGGTGRVRRRAITASGSSGPGRRPSSRSPPG